MPDTSAQCPEATGFVLAGGKSRRFGDDKAFYEIDGAPLLQRPLGCLTALFPSVAIVAKHPPRYAAFGVPVVADDHPRPMPHVGVMAGLEAAETAWSVVLACDMPSITPAVVRTLYEARGAEDAETSVEAVVPETPSGVHPLVGCYHRSVTGALRRAIEHEWSLRGWLSELSTRVVPFEDEEPFRNVNRKSDLPENA